MSEPEQTTALFDLGQIVSTPGALDTCSEEYLGQCLRRHMAGDWGCVVPYDKMINNQAVKEGYRILSAYPINPDKICTGFGDNTVWIITEADRSVTTFLLPDEY